MIYLYILATMMIFDKVDLIVFYDEANKINLQQFYLFK